MVEVMNTTYTKMCKLLQKRRMRWEFVSCSNCGIRYLFARHELRRKVSQENLYYRNREDNATKLFLIIEFNG